LILVVFISINRCGVMSTKNAKKPRIEAEKANGAATTADRLEVDKAIEVIGELQNEVDQLNEQASEEILKVEKKYVKLRRPFYEKRANHINCVPKFWSFAFLHHPQFSALLDEDDEDLFQNYLEKCDVQDLEDGKTGYTISFTFNENPYFENKVISKTLAILDSGAPASTSTTIKWKDGMESKRRQEAAVKGKRKHDDLENFFSWFHDSGELGADEEIGEVIKEDIWPNPLQFFLLGDVSQDEDDEEEDDESGEEDEEGLEDIVEEEDEEIEDTKQDE